MKLVVHILTRLPNVFERFKSFAGQATTQRVINMIIIGRELQQLVEFFTEELLKNNPLGSSNSQDFLRSFLIRVRCGYIGPKLRYGKRSIPVFLFLFFFNMEYDSEN